MRLDPKTRVVMAGLMVLLGVFAYAWGFQPIMLVGFGFGLAGVTGIWAPPGRIDRKGRLWTPGLNQSHIPLSAIENVRYSGAVVEIDWRDGLRTRTKRLYPARPPQFFEWVRAHRAGARAV